MLRHTAAPPLGDCNRYEYIYLPKIQTRVVSSRLLAGVKHMRESRSPPRPSRLPLLPPHRPQKPLTRPPLRHLPMRDRIEVIPREAHILDVTPEVLHLFAQLGVKRVVGETGRGVDDREGADG